MKKLLLLAGLAIGYVLGARAGRERYDQIMNLVNRIKDDPRVQQKAHQAMDVAKEQAPVVADKVTHAASAAASKVSGDGRHEAHHMAGPQGDLP
ncbi:MAG TPA: hypothetical protein VGK78_06525 [Nocardioides sp.]